MFVRGALLISDDMYVVLNTGPGFLDNSLTEVVLEIRTLDHRLLAAYQLPPMLAETSFVQEFVITAEVPSQMGRDSFTPLQSLLLPCSPPHILVLVYEAMGPDGVSLLPITMVILLSALLKGVSSSFVPTKVNYKPWESWGYKGTRCFCYTEIGPSIDGYRVFLHLDEKNSVLDFNPLSIARDISRGEAQGIVTEATVIHNGGVLLDDIQTGLPYRLTRMDLESETVTQRDMIAGGVDSTLYPEINDGLITFEVTVNESSRDHKLHALLM
jgi:hypothetical protein